MRPLEVCELGVTAEAWACQMLRVPVVPWLWSRFGGSVNGDASSGTPGFASSESSIVTGVPLVWLGVVLSTTTLVAQARCAGVSVVKSRWLGEYFAGFFHLSCAR